jgi:3-methyladenine DNA glycosylase AlkD
MQFVQKIQLLFDENRNAAKAEQMSAYLKGLFPFYGIMAGERRKLTAQAYKECGIPDDAIAVVKELFLLKERELHYVGQELMLKAKKQWTEDTIYDIYWLITNKSWWDSVDFIAAHLLGTYFKLYPHTKQEVLLRWNRSTNFWVVRSTILAQLNFKQDTDTTLLAKLILPHTEEKEFFIKKAIGWALRQYAKVDADWVRGFVQNHTLQPLSKKEALKNLS